MKTVFIEEIKSTGHVACCKNSIYFFD